MLIYGCKEEEPSTVAVLPTLECMAGHHRPCDRLVIRAAQVPFFFSLSLSSLTSTIALITGVKVSVLCNLLNLEHDSLEERLA
jgi:hypothetical protein